MFETAELGASISRSEYKEREPVLREELLNLQRELRECGKSSVIIVFAGVDGGGKATTVNLLNEWMDPRWLITHAYHESSDEERERPDYWRFWRDLPPRGQIGLFLSSWYSKPIFDSVYERTELAGFSAQLDHITAFESTLVDDRAVILKFWMHLSHAAQKQRLKSLESDPLTKWRVSKSDWAHWKLHKKFEQAAERTILRTNTGKAPWAIVEGEDQAFRSLTVGTIIRDSVRKHLDKMKLENAVKRSRNTFPAAGAGTDTGEETEPAPPAEAESGSKPADSAPPTLLGALDMSYQLAKTDYQEQLNKYQARASLLFRDAFEKGVSTIVVLEGPDAAGKGGAIRRLIAPLEARNYRVIPTGAPTEEERAQHYLWRFWRHLSRAGRLLVFDRSWYGRVLVERIEEFATEEEWKRAYSEINEFEEQLKSHGIVLLKFWIHITKDEQLERFKERENTPYKSWKLNDEDWRNREKWKEYELAVNDMVQYTSTVYNPWVLVEGNDKYFARIKVLKTICSSLADALKQQGNK